MRSDLRRGLKGFPMSNGKGSNGDLSQLSMHELFRMEAETQTAILSQGLLDLEKNSNSEEKLEQLMRASHSLKGAARIVGIDAVVNIAHAMEECFVAAQRHFVNLSSVHIDLLLTAVDLIVKIAHFDEKASSNWLSENQETIASLRRRILSILPNTSFEIPAQKDSSAVQTTSLDQLFADQDGYKGNTEKSVVEERVVRINADQLTRIMRLSSEILVESGWLRPFADSFVLLKRRHSELSTLMDSIREALEQIPVQERAHLLVEEVQKKLSDIRSMLSERLADLDDYDSRNSQLYTKMYNEVVSTRMRPFSDSIQGMERMVRDISRKLKKKVQLVVEGENTPADREILQKIKAPIIHLVRNAIDHGIETPGARIAKGKSEQGVIHVSASHTGGILTISIADDGKGIDLEKLKSKILLRHIASEDIVKSLTKDELLEFLFLPDFSTKSRVTEFSGRGIGLDIVRSIVQEMQGSISLNNTIGKGLKITLQLPLTLSVITAVVAEISDEQYAFPLSRVDRLLTLAPEEVIIEDGYQCASIDNQLIKLVPASHVLELNERPFDYRSINVVVISDRMNRFGLIVDRFIGQRELFVQSLDSRLGKIQDISAVALNENGMPILIVDVDDLVRSIYAITRNSTVDFSKRCTNESSKILQKRILVIDDSLTVRELEKRLLEEQGYRVDVAVDGMDGWNAVRRNRYQLVITDVDMPRMDGIELVTSIRKDNQLHSLPVMIISYKDRSEDRFRGLEAGADYYLAKGGFSDEALVEAVIDLIGDAIE